MGIIREAIYPQILEDTDGKVHKEEMIDPALVVLSNKAREMEMNFLNNTENCMLDQFRSFKWLFHEIEDLKEKI